MQTAFIVSLIFCIIPAIMKGIVHVALDVRNGYKVDFARSKGYVYLLPYNKDVSDKDEKLKRICNYLQKGVVFFLIIFVIVFFVRFVLSQ
jgi:hypothetical protein